MQIVGEAADGLEAVQKAEELCPDLILLDIGLPKLSGIQAARKILTSVPHTKIVFVTQESSAEVVDEAFRVGAFGYVKKVNAGIEIETAVQAVRRAKEPIQVRRGIA